MLLNKPFSCQHMILPVVGGGSSMASERAFSESVANLLFLPPLNTALTAPSTTASVSASTASRPERISWFSITTAADARLGAERSEVEAWSLSVCLVGPGQAGQTDRQTDRKTDRHHGQRNRRSAEGGIGGRGNTHITKCNRSLCT